MLKWTMRAWLFLAAVGLIVSQLSAATMSVKKATALSQKTGLPILAVAGEAT
jgi:hypothetical protein